MNRRQSNQDKRNQKIVAVLDAHPTELLTIPAVDEAARELRARMGLTQPAVSQQLKGRRAKGAAKAKNDLEGPLVKQIVKAANALSLFYKKAGHLDRAQALHLRPSEYTRLTEPALVLEAQDVADQLTENLAGLAPYGYQPASGKTPGSDAALHAQVAAYAASLPGASTARGQGKLGTGTVRNVFKDIAAYIDGDFRSAVELLVDDHQDLYTLLRDAMRIGGSGGGGKKAKAGPGTPPTPGA